MLRSCVRRRRAAGEHGTAVEGMLARERELVAQLRELLLPSPTPMSGDSASWSSGPVAELFDNIDGCPVKEALSGLPGACGHASTMAEAPVVPGGRRRRRGSKRAREKSNDEEGGGATANCSKSASRKKPETTRTARTLVTTVPDFDGYQWRKYGQKQIEGAKYPRGYYRCTNSTQQGCPAKRTVQRHDDDVGIGMNGDGGPPKYTVVYIAEHICKTTESVAPVILETTVRTKKPAADNDAAAHVLLLAPDDVVVPADSTTIGSSTTNAAAAAATTTTNTGTEPPAISSDITWSSDANSNDHDYYPRVDGLLAVDDWQPTPAAATLVQEMDINGPIRSPVHIPADGWIDDLLVNQSLLIC